MANSSVQSRQSRSWGKTISGLTILAVGLQGTTADAVGEQSLQSPDEGANAKETGRLTKPFVERSAAVEPVAPETTQPRFAQWRIRLQAMVNQTVQQADEDLEIGHLENHRRELHRRSNQVESQLLELQQLLSLQAYGTSFADRLLEDDQAYQAKLQELRSLEADIHRALDRSDEARLKRLQFRLEQADRELRQQAQRQLRQYIAQAQMSSTLGLWQEPMYRESLKWLMEHTHERHLLQARQQTLASTLVAMTAN